MLTPTPVAIHAPRFVAQPLVNARLITSATAIEVVLTVAPRQREVVLEGRAVAVEGACVDRRSLR